ncbi:MAG: hypothetical protein HUJ66_07610 [Oscillospiraceae bacterium]|nr:hypothetical protein [Oscillospiraceae bacterium]
MKYDKAANVVKTGLVLSVLFALVGFVAEDFNARATYAATLIGMVFFVASIIVAYLYCKCPYCGKHIIMGMFRVKNCPKCHRNLETGKKKGSKRR